MCGLGAGAIEVGCPSCWQIVQEQGHLLLLRWLRCPRPEKVSLVLHCGPALSGPKLLGYGLPKVNDLPAVKQKLPQFFIFQLIFSGRKLTCPFLIFFWVKEAYMSIDANHISNSKDR